MALILKRITWPYECVRCCVTGKLITYGEEYYWDPQDNFIVDFEYYYDMQLEQKRQAEMWRVEEASSMLSYKQQMLAAERDFLNQTMFDREIYDPAKHGPLNEYLEKERYGEPPIQKKGGR